MRSMFNQDFLNHIHSLLLTTVKVNEPLKHYTTSGVGGEATYLVSVTTLDQAQATIKLASEYHIPVLVLGGGSNVIISDAGFDGLVIRCLITDFRIETEEQNGSLNTPVIPRFSQTVKNDWYVSNKLQPSFSDQTPTVLVTVGAGWKNTALIQKCLKENITGLEWFMGIPGSVGGGVYMNIHGGSYFYSDFIQRVTVIDTVGNVKQYASSDLAFGYDSSLLQKTHEMVVLVTFRLYYGDVVLAQKNAHYWGTTKVAHQPQKSAGCLFQNLTAQQQQQLNLPTPSVGYLIDHVLGLKGKTCGGARISPKHCAFIENMGDATAADYKNLVELIEQTAVTKTGIALTREVEFI